MLWFIGFVVDLKSATWDESIIKGLDFIQNYVLQVPFFMMTMMRYITPTLDNMFMDSLAWVDKTYYAKHQNEDQSKLRETYYPNLRQYPTSDGSSNSKSAAEGLTLYLTRLARKAGISLAVLALSYVPYVGRLVLPAASFYTFKNVAGLGPAGIVFGAGVFLPRKYLVIFLQSYFASRSLMRELVSVHGGHIRNPTNCYSSNHISHASSLRKSRKDTGFTIEKDFCLALVLASTSSYAFPCLES